MPDLVTLEALFRSVATALDGDRAIEAQARAHLIKAAPGASAACQPIDLPASLHSVLRAPDAHAICGLVSTTPLPWAPPRTSDDPAYVAASHLKVHVELLGPDGLVYAPNLRLGLYGMQPGADYGIRTHPADEIFVMLAGRALWKMGDDGYREKGPGARAYHPSMTPHATRTEDTAFLSIYVWSGDVSTDGYRYQG